MANATLEKPETKKETYRFKVLSGIHVGENYGPNDIEVIKGQKTIRDQRYYGPHAECGDIIETTCNLLKLNSRGYPPKFALLQVGETGLGINNPDGLDSLGEVDLKKFAKANMIDLPVDATKSDMIMSIRAASK